jgi:hypothetical protein
VIGCNPENIAASMLPSIFVRVDFRAHGFFFLSEANLAHSSSNFLHASDMIISVCFDEAVTLSTSSANDISPSEHMITIFISKASKHKLIGLVSLGVALLGVALSSILRIVHYVLVAWLYHFGSHPKYLSFQMVAVLGSILAVSYTSLKLGLVS